MCCGNSLFNKNDNSKNIKFVCDAQGASLAVVNGAGIVSKINLCDFSIPYNQYNTSQMFLEAGALNREIITNIGTKTRFLFIKVQYVNSMPTNSTFPTNPQEIPTISYTFYNEPNTIRYIDTIMILTGTSKTENKLPRIFLSNPNTITGANITIMASTDIISYDNSDITQSGDDVITVENLTWNNLSTNNNILTITSQINTTITMRWIDITYISPLGDFEKNGKIITIHDYSKGTINLSFIDEYNAYQAYSLLRWALYDKDINIITGTNPTDDIAPIILYTSNINTDIIFDEFPPISASTCGISGTDLCEIYIGIQGNGILKEDLFTYLFSSISDNRDLDMIFNYNNLTITPINSIIQIDEITNLGKYHLVFSTNDNAGNIVIDSFILNVKDTLAPKLILNNLGIELYNINSINLHEYINLYSNNTINITVNDYFYIKFNSTYNETSHLIFSPNVIVIKNNGTEFLFDINASDVNDILIWNINDIGIIKQFILNSITYNVELIEFNNNEIIFTINI